MCEIWPMPMTLALASNTSHCSTAHTRDTYWEPQRASHGNYRVELSISVKKTNPSN